MLLSDKLVCNQTHAIALYYTNSTKSTQYYWVGDKLVERGEMLANPQLFRNNDNAYPAYTIDEIDRMLSMYNADNSYKLSLKRTDIEWRAALIKAGEPFIFGTGKELVNALAETLYRYLNFKMTA